MIYHDLSPTLGELPPQYISTEWQYNLEKCCAAIMLPGYCNKPRFNIRSRQRTVTIYGVYASDTAAQLVG